MTNSVNKRVSISCFEVETGNGKGWRLRKGNSSAKSDTVWVPILF